MQNVVVFNTHCTYISRILGTNFVHTIEATKRLNIWLNITNLYILTGLLKVKLKIQNMQILVILSIVLHQTFPNYDFSKIL